MNKLLSILFAAIVMLFSYTCAVSAQDSAVGLYYPDIKAIRTLIGPTAIPDLPLGQEYTKLLQSWNQISTKGRELLLKERDLALVVVDSAGDWLYRSTGVHTLRSLHETNEERNENDLSNLLLILRNFWFQQLRDFYDHSLFAANYPAASSAFGKLLDRVDETNDATNDEKNWFRSIVGAELDSMDNDTRKALLIDEKYGRKFVDAIALAEATRTEQLESIASAFAFGSQQTVLFNDVVYQFPVDDEESAKARRDVNFRFVHGKKLMEVSTMDTVWWVAAMEDDQEVPLELSAPKLQSLLKNDEAMVFVGGHGNSKIYEVKDK